MIDDDDDDDDDDDEVAHGWRPRGGERAQRDTAPKVIVIDFHRDSELGQMSMTCGKLSNQAPSVKSRFNGSGYSSTQ